MKSEVQFCVCQWLTKHLAKETFTNFLSKIFWKWVCNMTNVLVLNLCVQRNCAQLVLNWILLNFVGFNSTWKIYWAELNKEAHTNLHKQSITQLKCANSYFPTTWAFKVYSCMSRIKAYRLPRCDVHHVELKYNDLIAILGCMSTLTKLIFQARTGGIGFGRWWWKTWRTLQRIHVRNVWEYHKFQKFGFD